MLRGLARVKILIATATVIAIAPPLAVQAKPSTTKPNSVVKVSRFQVLPSSPDSHRQMGSKGSESGGKGEGETALTLAEVREWQKRPPQVHKAPASESASQGVTTIYPGEDHITIDQCRQMWADDPNPDGSWHFRNHYSACQVWPVGLAHFECQTPPSTNCTYIGKTKFRITIRGLGWNNRRETNWEIVLDQWDRELREDLTVPVAIDVPCTPYLPEAVSCASSGPTVKSLAQWKLDPTHVQSTVNTITSPEIDDEHPEEKRSHYQYYPQLLNQRSGERFQTYWTVGRCDNASYITTSTNGGCSFTGTAGILPLDYSHPEYADSAQFIHTAMHNLAAVKPNSIGLYVPGGYYTQPMTGNFEPLTRNYYGKRKRGVVQAMCRKMYTKAYTRGPGGTKLECDEYPFSATYQNANYDTIGTASTWAVKPVSASHNGAAGRRLGEFLTNDRILEKDPFYVAIENAP